MTSPRGPIKTFWQEDAGATSVEYAVMLALIFMVIISAVSALGTKVSSAFVEAESGW